MHLYELPACLALISSAFVCVVAHVIQKGHPFGAMLIHLGTLFGGLHYYAVSQTLMSTAMERGYRVPSPSPLPSLN